MKTSKKIPLRCAAFLVAATLFSTLSAETKALPNSPSPTVAPRDDMSKLSHSDRSFLEKAAKAGMKEVEISQVVEGRVMDPQVKNFAQMMVSDHMTANTELASLAAQKGVTLPRESTKASEKWAKKDKDLDKDYVKEMKEDHEDAVKLFEKGAKSDDPDIAAFAKKTLPELQHHLAVITGLDQSMN
jgi:putative membrane protein